MSARPYRPTTLGPRTPEAQLTPRRRSSMVVPRGTAARREEEHALLELEAALSACLHPPPSTESPTPKKPGRVIPRDTLTGALLVFPRQPPTLVAQVANVELPRPLATTMLMESARARPSPVAVTPMPPAPMATTLTLSGPPPWYPTPLPFATTVPVPAKVSVARPRGRAKWLALVVVLLAITGILAVRPQLRARTKATAVVVGKRIAKTAVIVKDHARRALHR